MMIKKSLLLSIFFISFFSFSQQITVEDIWKSYKFLSKRVKGFRSMNDGVSYTKMAADQSIIKYSITNPKDTGVVLIKGSDLMMENKPILIDDYQFNKDETKILLLSNQKYIYRRSYSADYYLYDINTKLLIPLDASHSPQTLAEYSPDGKKVSYVYKNDLYVKDIKTGKVRAITEDGKRNKVINGTTDWVYEEEFGITKAYEWSHDSEYIAFLKFNEKKVRKFNMTYFNGLYPNTYKFKYPKAGEDNSKVSLHIASVNCSKIKKVEINDYEYLPRLKCSKNKNELVILSLNRHQNHLKYHLVDFSEKKYKKIIFHEEKSDTYVEIDNNLLILNDGKSILRTSEKNGYNHIYKVDFSGEQTQITNGNWDVIEFLGIDDDNKFLYYSSAENSPISKSIYKVNIAGSEKQLLSPMKGYSNASFTKGMKCFVLTHSNANKPPVYSLCLNNGKELRKLESNDRLNKKLSEYNLSKREFLTIPSDTTLLNAWMIKPLNFDPNKKYPVFMTVYGGPGHNEVTDSWGGMKYMFYQLLAQKGYIVFSVDPRGTMYRGEAFKKSTYLQLGKLETEDIINAAISLSTLPYIDKNRIGIQGWSYGGFMSSLAITKGADVFCSAIAVAPVTNWRYYDNIYTERFMRTPKENTSGYDNNSPINFVDKIKGRYLLIHGSADDNVHFQNTMEMVNALVKADKQFDLFVYPNKDHGIYGGNTRNHLFKLMLDFILESI